MFSFRNGLRGPGFLLVLPILLLAMASWCWPVQGEIITEDLSIVASTPVVPPIDVDAFQPAFALLQKGKVSEARSLLEKISQQHEDRPNSEIMLADLLFKVGNSQLAQKTLEQIRADQCNPFELRMAFLRLSVSQGRWFDGYTHGQIAATQEKPSHWKLESRRKADDEVCFLLATCCQGRADWNGVLENLAKPGFLPESYPVAALLRAKAYFYLDRFDDAKAELTRYREVAPEIDSPELSLAQVSLEAENNQLAEQYFQAAMALPNRSDAEKAKLGYARYLLWNNRSDDALKSLAFETDDQTITFEHKFLCSLASRMEGDFPAARKLLSELHQKDPTSFPFSNQLALVLIEEEDESLRSRALQIAESNVRNHQDMVEAWSTLGWVQFRLGDVASAEKHLANAIQAGTNSRDTILYMARLQEALGHQEERTQLLEIAKQMPGPTYLPTSFQQEQQK